MSPIKSVVPLSAAVQPEDAGAPHGDGNAEPAARIAPRPAARPAQASPPAAVHSAFVPLLLAMLALVGWLAFQTLLTVGERAALQNVHAGQQRTVDNAIQLRNSLDALAADTQRLADAGNPNAGLLVAELRKRGVTINVTAAAAAAPAASR